MKVWCLQCNVFLFKKRDKNPLVDCVIKANDESVLPMYHQRFESSISDKEEVVMKRRPHTDEQVRGSRFHPDCW